MKRTIVAFLVSTTLIFAGCSSNGPSAEMKTTMKTFETGWKSTGEMMTKWGETMNTTMGEMDKMMKAMPMADSMAMSKMKPDEMKMHMDMNMECKNMMGEMDAMKTTYSGAMETWKADEAAYMDWKKKADAGDVTAEDMTKTMAEWNTKLAASKTMMEEWNTSLMKMSEDCKKMCAMPM